MSSNVEVLVSSLPEVLKTFEGINVSVDAPNIEDNTSNLSEKGSKTALAKGRSKRARKSDENHVENESNNRLEDNRFIRLNAFQLMMNSRHNVIGRNSPGKELEAADDETTAEIAKKKSSLSERKKKLENWCESKGAIKRKREYEETTNTIAKKLDKRTKRLKKLLKYNGNSESDDEIIVKKTRKRSKTIKSDDDPDTDGISSTSPPTGEKSPENKAKNALIESWKLKIALKMDEELEKEEPDNDESPQEELESIITEVGRRLRPRKQQLKLKDESSEDEQPRKVTKIAPIFLKSTPKPKLDSRVVEERRQFLLSGIPDSFKRELQKQTSNDDVEYDIFPAISHVIQKTTSKLWDLPKANLQLIPDIPYNPPPLVFALLKLQNTLENGERISNNNEINDKSCKLLLKDIKDANPNYPVCKTFKNLRIKSGYHERELIPTASEQKPPKRGRGRPRKSDPVEPLGIIQAQENTNPCSLTWVDKYKAQLSGDILGNKKSINSLKIWLENWLRQKNPNKSSDSDSDFALTSGDSRDSSNSRNKNTIIVSGPLGCGKSTAIYAICNELGLDLLEINASSKRTGKKLLIEVQEATQSHQVHKKRQFQLVNHKNPKGKGKMCVILIEDVDIVFDQDDGFITALTQIISSSKRPIILTTSDKKSSVIQKFINNNQIIDFSPSSPAILDIWLQIVCLLEGVFIKKDLIHEIMIVNKGDVRKILNYLQFWASSDKKANQITNFNTKPHESRLDLNLLWWNLPRLLDFDDYSKFRLNKSVKNDNNEVKASGTNDLRSVCSLYDTLSTCDILIGRNYRNRSSKSYNFCSDVKDGLSLQENLDLYDDPTISDDLINILVTNSLRVFNSDGVLVPTLPTKEELRWLSCCKRGEDNLQQILQTCSYLDLNSIYLDYMPMLRAFARLETHRAKGNTKRNNRFSNYLTNFGIYTDNVNFKLACDVFKP